ncbi:MAG: hypothetical protein Q7U51_04725 [Methanoregula sp.]|nr:hypothetical protein [Methanoregula sp.]
MLSGQFSAWKGENASRNLILIAEVFLIAGLFFVYLNGAQSIQRFFDPILSGQIFTLVLLVFPVAVPQTLNELNSERASGGMESRFEIMVTKGMWRIERTDRWGN